MIRFILSENEKSIANTVQKGQNFSLGDKVAERESEIYEF